MEPFAQLPDVPPEVLEYLDTQYTMTLATADGNLPYAATLVFVNRSILFYVCAGRESVTARHIAHNPAVAFTIDQYNPDWNRAKGVLGTGEARQVTGDDEIAPIVLRFQDKFPFLTEIDTSHLAFFQVTPVSIEYIDNERAAREQGAPPLGLEYARAAVFNVFHELPPREVEAISAALEPLSVPAGEVIVRQNEGADRFFIIVEGEVEVTREENGKVHTVAYLGRGQFFGEMAVLMDTPRTATVTARVPTQLLVMERAMFRSLLAQSLATSEDFDTLIRRRLGELERLRNP